MPTYTGQLGTSDSNWSQLALGAVPLDTPAAPIVIGGFPAGPWWPGRALPQRLRRRRRLHVGTFVALVTIGPVELRQSPDDPDDEAIILLLSRG